jgi:hypothetical protein
MGEKGGRSARAARSPGLVWAQRMFALHERSERVGAPVAEVRGKLEQETTRDRSRAQNAGGQTRRELLIGAGGLAVGTVLSGSSARAMARRISGVSPKPRIAIVGAGLAVASGPPPTRWHRVRCSC